MKPIIVPPGGGKEVCAFGDTVIFKVVGEQTGSDVTVAMAITPPGGGPPPHMHRNEHEIFIIESGEIELWSDGEWTPAAPGSVVFLPKGVPHSFRNAGSTPSRMWVVATPSGFESFFGKCSKEFAAGGPPDMDRLLQICAEHGIEVLGPPPGAH